MSWFLQQWNIPQKRQWFQTKLSLSLRWHAHRRLAGSPLCVPTVLTLEPSGAKQPPVRGAIFMLRVTGIRGPYSAWPLGQGADLLPLRLKLNTRQQPTQQQPSHVRVTSDWSCHIRFHLIGNSWYWKSLYTNIGTWFFRVTLEQKG